MAAHTGRSGKKRAWRVLVVTVMIAFALAVTGLRFYVFPTTNLAKADAVYILGGHDNQRYRFGVELAQKGWAQNVVLSNPDAEWWLDAWCEGRPIVTAATNPLPYSTASAGLGRYCVYPKPATTTGEAKAFRDLARARGWRSVILVTSRQHVSRAAFIFGRCFDGDISASASPTDLTVKQWASEFLYQTGGFIKAVATKGC